MSANSLKLLTVADLCELWGVKKSWVYDQAEQDPTFPVKRLGNRMLRFSETELAEWLDKKKDR